MVHDHHTVGYKKLTFSKATSNKNLFWNAPIYLFLVQQSKYDINLAVDSFNLCTTHCVVYLYIYIGFAYEYRSQLQFRGIFGKNTSARRDA